MARWKAAYWKMSSRLPYRSKQLALYQLCVVSHLFLVLQIWVFKKWLRCTAHLGSVSGNCVNFTPQTRASRGPVLQGPVWAHSANQIASFGQGTPPSKNAGFKLSWKLAFPNLSHSLNGQKTKPKVMIQLFFHFIKKKIPILIFQWLNTQSNALTTDHPTHVPSVLGLPQGQSREGLLLLKAGRQVEARLSPHSCGRAGNSAPLCQHHGTKWNSPLCRKLWTFFFFRDWQIELCAPESNMKTRWSAPAGRFYAGRHDHLQRGFILQQNTDCD